MNRFKKSLVLSAAMMLISVFSQAQTATLSGKVTSKNTPVEFANVFIKGTQLGSSTDIDGNFVIKNIPPGTVTIVASSLGFDRKEKTIILTVNENAVLNFELTKNYATIDEVVVTGTMKEVRKSESPVPVTIISAKMFQKNPTSNILDALYAVNGINPQVNCNMCNTSDIGINGMQGPYTMILIDGMPIVSSLSTVYGLSGIPNDIIDRVEIVKGPASSLYGSEAIGGVINIITKDATNAPKFFVDINGSTWGELTGNMGFGAKVSKNVSTLFSADGYYFNTEHDQDKDGYMDKTLQRRLSLFNKWDFKQKYNKKASISMRYYTENRHGGELGWNKKDRDFVDFESYNDNPNSPDYNADYVLPNGYTIYNQKYAKGFRIPKFTSEAEKQAWLDEVHATNPDAKLIDHMKYQESIFTNRFEAIGKWELPIKENITLQASYNQHDQNSAYGTELFRAHQKTAFGQAYWDRKFRKHDLLAGATFRYIWYRDNTIASNNGKNPFITQMPGIFIQDLWTLTDKTSLLLGYRFDYDMTESESGSHKNAVHSPRIAFKYTSDRTSTFRVNIGTGYRVVNIFNEDHRALSGQYEAKFGGELKPETSLSGVLDYEKRWATESIGLTMNLSAYYTHFFNKIYPIRNDEDRTITYYNVNGKEHARNFGGSLDFILNFSIPLQISAGVTYSQAELYEFERNEDGEVESNSLAWNPFEFSPKWSGVFSISYEFIRGLRWDVTGEWKSPMRLPTQGDMDIYDVSGNVIGVESDPRSEWSPSFMKLNTQLSYQFKNGVQIYGGVKNLFNYVPKNLLVNINDPFNDIAAVRGGLGFDTEYNYTPQQGITGFLGIRFNLR